MYFYEILQSIMDEKKTSIADVARLSGLTDSTVRSIITRKNKTVALEVAFKLSKGLGVSLQRLNGETFEADSDTLKQNNVVDEITEKYTLLNDNSKKIVSNLVVQLLEMQEEIDKSNKKEMK